MAATKILRRSELYNLVWQQPMARLAQNFAISDVGLAKICRKFDIPRPPRGYWAKKQVGQEPKQLPLPPSEKDHEIELRDGSESLCVETESPAGIDGALAAGEGKAWMPIKVADSLRGAHVLVSQTNKELLACRANEYGMVNCPESSPLAVTTSKSSLHRALLIMDALLKALEQAGYSVARGPRVEIFGTTLSFRIVEELETKREPADDDKLEGHYEFGFNRFNERRCPSGRLTLSINEGGSYWLNGCRHTWRDTAKSKIEDRLDQFVAGLAKLAKLIRQHEIEIEKQNELKRQEEQRRAEQARVLAEKRKRFKEEQARLDQLLLQADSWNKSKLIRELVEAVRQAHSANALLTADSSILQWIEWATLQADRLDPLRLSPPSILDEQLPEEEPPRRDYYQRW